MSSGAAFMTVGLKKTDKKEEASAGSGGTTSIALAGGGNQSVMTVTKVAWGGAVPLVDIENTSLCPLISGQEVFLRIFSGSPSASALRGIRD
jgi:hypothetical protein